MATLTGYPVKEAREYPGHAPRIDAVVLSGIYGQSDHCVHGAYRTVCIDVETTFHAPCAMIPRVLL